MILAKLKHLLPIAFLISSPLIWGQGASFGAADRKEQTANTLRDYWTNGTVEMNTYMLMQTGDEGALEGEMVLLYALEDVFQPDCTAFADKAILRLSMVKKNRDEIFESRLTTHIYTPANGLDETPEPTVKIIYGAEQWEEQHYSRVEKDQNGYRIKSYSFDTGEALRTRYFTAMPEEDVWTRMRLDPLSLPMGSFEMIPGQEYLDRHSIEPESYGVIGKLQLQITADHLQHYVYQLYFPELQRRVEWRFEAYFPYTLLNWEEKMNHNGTVYKNSAVLTKTLRTAHSRGKKRENAASGDTRELRLN